MKRCMTVRASLVGAALIAPAAGGCAATHADPALALVIAHRGLSEHLPEHTLEAYAAAYFDGADIIEPDVLATRDARLVCFHDLTLGALTDVRTRFPDRARDDGRWYAIDFDLAELKSLEVVGRDGGWVGAQIPTLSEMLALVERLNRSTGRRVGVIPEIKKPGFHARHGVDLASRTLNELREASWSTDLVYIQCFDLDTLGRLHAELRCEYPLLYLTGETLDQPTLEGVARIAGGIGPSRRAIEADPTLVPRAHALGMIVFPYTFRAEPDAVRVYAHEIGVDGLFVNDTGSARRVLAPPNARD